MSIHKLRKRFVKDNGLPIHVLQDPVFEYLLQLYDSIYDCKAGYQKFLEKVEQYGGGDAYLKYTHGLTETISNHVKAKASYENFLKPNAMDNYQPRHIANKRDIYHSSNHEKWFVSIDLKQANYQSLKHFDPELVDLSETYEKWMETFTDLPDLIHSKNVRQMIFGNLNSKRQSRIQQWIMDQFLAIAIEEFDLSAICATSSDEIVIETNPELWKEKENVFCSSIEKLGFNVKVQLFQLLKNAEPSDFGYIKMHSNGEVEFKCVHALFYPQAFKHYFQLELNENDLIFFHENLLCSFLKPLLSKDED
jgi:hypothetical protein